MEKTHADYLPDLVGRIEHAETIILRMMVQNQSGIPNITDTPSFCATPPKSSREEPERVLDLPADFAPGEKFEYSNTNYVLISELIKKPVGLVKR